MGFGTCRYLPTGTRTRGFEHVLSLRQNPRNTKCWFEVKTYTPDANGHEDTNKFIPGFHTVGYHQSGDIWATASSVAEWDFLVATTNLWLPLEQAGE